MPSSTDVYLCRSANGQPRPAVASLRSVAPSRRVNASYDAARTTDEFKNYWANADALDADSANSKGVRETLVRRSRYEVGNNGFADGMVQTHANYLVGVGPTLRMQTGSSGFNQAVELVWYRWAKAVMLRRKLWCMAHAKVQDGEAIGLVRENPGVRHPVPLDVVLIETEQCQTPYLPFATDGYVDGIRFDQYGNAVWYDILRYHPGGSVYFANQDPEQVPAKFVLHWFCLRRPGGHRGVPEFRSTLNTGAASRRWREATVAAAETAADFAALLKTQMAPDDGPDVAAAFSSIDIQKRMMTALPMGWDAVQMDAKHPNAQYERFLRTQINEQARPKSIPYNLAACDSSSYNYASGRLDHQTYFSGLNVEREDGNDLVLDPLFRLWWSVAVREYGWNSDPDSPPDHYWDWPRHPVADVVSEANSNDTRLRNGSTTIVDLYSQAGEDFEDKVTQLATAFGVDEATIRKTLFQLIFAPKSGGTLPATEDDSADETEDDSDE